MKRLCGAAALCLCLTLAAGCALVSDKTKVGKKKEKHKVDVLGIPVWRSEKPVVNPPEPVVYPGR